MCSTFKALTQQTLAIQELYSCDMKESFILPRTKIWQSHKPLMCNFVFSETVNVAHFLKKTKSSGYKRPTQHINISEEPVTFIFRTGNMFLRNFGIYMTAQCQIQRKRQSLTLLLLKLQIHYSHFLLKSVRLMLKKRL